MPASESSPPPPDIQAIFNEPADIATTRTYRKWKSMKTRQLPTFRKQHQQTFLRRMRRGVPQKFRWESWCVCVELNEVLEAKNLEKVIELIPFEVAGSEDVTDAFSKSKLTEMRETTTPVELFDMLSSRPSKFASLIDIDVARTFPEIRLFDEGAQKYLHTILNAYANFAPHVGYCQGMNFVMGFIMMVSNFAPMVETYWFFAIIMSRYQLHGFFREGFPVLDAYITTFDQLAEFYAPELRQHFAQENVLPPVYLHQWYLTLFVTSLPLGTVVVVWDFILCLGLHALLPVTLALLKVLQSFLLRLKFEGIVKFLKSLRSSGDCDESKIGKMLVKQAEHYPIFERHLAAIVNIDFAVLLEPRRTMTRRSTSIEGLDLSSIVLANQSNSLNPLDMAMKEIQQEDGDDEEGDDESVPTGSSSIMKTSRISAKENSSGSGFDEGRHRRLRFLPKVIGRK